MNQYNIASEVFNILIVDDNPKNIQVLGSLLRKTGYNLEFAIDGVTALSWVEQDSFDLILLDIMMPGMSGFEVCEQIKKMENRKDIPIIFLTAKTDMESLVKGFDVGAVDFITKPFNAKELLCRVQTHIELQWQRKELAKANAEKDKFYSIVAHDIKNPFTSLATTMELIEQVFDVQDKEKLKKKVLKVKDDIDTIVTTSTNLLQWARNQSAKLVPIKESINLLDAVKEEIEFLRLMASNKKVIFEINIENDLDVLFNREQLGIVIRNLISNAIKFSYQGGFIEITAKSQLDFVLVYFRDFGLGMTGEILNNLFDIKAKVTRAGTANEKGTGLGLLLVDEFIKSNGGLIDVESKLEEGASFNLRIPIP